MASINAYLSGSECRRARTCGSVHGTTLRSSSRGRVLSTIEEMRPTLTRARYKNLLLEVFCIEKGVDPELARHALEAVRPIARRHDLLDVEDDLGQRRLDFEEGREVAAG